MYRELHLHSYVSPRSRAQGTLELLNVGCRDGLPWLRGDGKGPSRTQARVEVTEAIREWDYGEYEGLTSREIRDLRAKHGQGAWDIWREGCPGGEYVLSFSSVVVLILFRPIALAHPNGKMESTSY